MITHPKTIGRGNEPSNKLLEAKATMKRITYERLCYCSTEPEGSAARDSLEADSESLPPSLRSAAVTGAVAKEVSKRVFESEAGKELAKCMRSAGTKPSAKLGFKLEELLRKADEGLSPSRNELFEAFFGTVGVAEAIPHSTRHI